MKERLIAAFYEPLPMGMVAELCDLFAAQFPNAQIVSGSHEAVADEKARFAIVVKS